MNKIPYGRQDITKEDEVAVLAALRGDFLTQGPHVEQFEELFAEYVGSKYAVAVTNGTAALHLAALSLGVSKGDRVIVPANTFVASANCILYCGGEVEFVDIDEKTFCIDPQKLEDMLKSKPAGYYKGVIPVDFAGYPVNLEELRSIANRYGIWILEDACHAPGAAFKTSTGTWSKSGSGEWADIAIFSFHPVKHIACGEGGMITTNNKSLYDRVKKLRTHGITRDKTEMLSSDGPWYYEMQELGFNYRISDILCALGSSQLKSASIKLNRRNEIALTYNNLFQNMNLKTPWVNQEIKHAFHLYVIQVENRKKVFEGLMENNIYPQVHYIPVYDQPFYKKRYGQQKLEKTSAYYERCLSLPMFPQLLDDQVEYVVKTVGRYI